MAPLIIGVCGGTGSGKTTLARNIVRTFGEDAVLLGMDSYYKSNWEMPFEERVKINYDHPNAFDIDLFLEHIKDLRAGKSVRCPIYDYTIHQRAKEYETVPSKPLIVIEGILLFENKEITDLMDVKIFVDTDSDVRLARRIKRDVEERGRSLDSVLGQYLTTVKPMHEQFVEPSKRRADIIVPEGGENRVALDMIVHTILNRIQ